jgi:hypothetical protein
MSRPLIVEQIARIVEQIAVSAVELAAEAIQNSDSQRMISLLTHSILRTSTDDITSAIFNIENSNG